MASKTIRILSFDPGVGQMGWAVTDYDCTTGRSHVLKYGLIKGDQVAKELRKIMLPEFSKQYTVLCAIRDTVKLLMSEYRPDYVVSEGPFAHRFVQAYASLKLVVDRLRQASHEVLNKNTYEVQPTEVKLLIFGKGTANKDEVKAGVLKCKDMTIKASKVNPIEHASEHEIDAIAVGYCFVKRTLPSILAEAQARSLDKKIK